MPFGTRRYSSNFDEATSLRPSTSRSTLPWNQFATGSVAAGWAAGGAGAAGGVCAEERVLVTRRPQAISTMANVMRFMAHLTKNAPDG